MRIMRSSGLLSFLVMFTATVLFVPFLSRQYDQNGIIEAAAVEQGLSGLFSPNHLLYRPIGALAYGMSRAFGYDGPAVNVLQFVTALCAAVAVGLVFRAFLILAERPLSALFATGLLATSWGFWTFSTDAYYITPAAMAAAGALLVALRPGLGLAGSTAVGVLAALAVLLWQANVFLVPALLAVIFWSQRSLPLQRRTCVALIVGSTATALTALSYLAIGILALGHSNPSALIGWMTNYGGARLPMWGRLEVGRVVPAAISAVASIIPVTEGLGLRELLRGRLSPGNLPGQIALIGLLSLSLLTAARIIRALRARTMSLGALACFALGYVIFLPFLVWWDPFEPKWFVVPNLFLAAILAIAWSTTRMKGFWLWAPVICLIFVAFGNFASTIWPRHTQPNPMLLQANCIAAHTTTSDMILTTDWRWNGYLSYFHNRTVFDVVHESGVADEPDQVTSLLEQRARAAQEAGGQVYMPDLRQYGAVETNWFVTQTGLAPEDLLVIPAYPAFRCGDVLMLRFSPLGMAVNP